MSLYIQLYKFIYKYPAMTQEIIHYPSLKTVLMVEEALKNADGLVNRTELKEMLPKQVMHQTLNLILEYLAESGKILDGHKGILWIHNPSKKMAKAIEEGLEL